MMTGCSLTPPTPTNPKPWKGREKKCCRCILGALNLPELSKPWKGRKKECCRCILGALNLPEPPKDRAAPKTTEGRVKVMPTRSTKLKIIGLILPDSRI